MKNTTFVAQMIDCGYTNRGSDVSWEDLDRVKSEIASKTCRLSSDARRAALKLIELKAMGQKITSIRIKGEEDVKVQDGEQIQERVVTDTP
jgi:hypothetical protein